MMNFLKRLFGEPQSTANNNTNQNEKMINLMNTYPAGFEGLYVSTAEHPIDITKYPNTAWHQGILWCTDKPQLFEINGLPLINTTMGAFYSPDDGYIYDSGSRALVHIVGGKLMPYSWKTLASSNMIGWVNDSYIEGNHLIAYRVTEDPTNKAPAFVINPSRRILSRNYTPISGNFRGGVYKDGYLLSGYDLDGNFWRGWKYLNDNNLAEPVKKYAQINLTPETLDYYNRVFKCGGGKKWATAPKNALITYDQVNDTWDFTTGSVSLHDKVTEVDNGEITYGWNLDQTRFYTAKNVYVQVGADWLLRDVAGNLFSGSIGSGTYENGALVSGWDLFFFKNPSNKIHYPTLFVDLFA